MSFLDWYSALLILIIFIYMFMFIYSFKMHNNSFTNIFTFICLVGFIYVLGVFLQVKAANIDQIVFARKVKYFGLPFLVGAWMTFYCKVNFPKDINFNKLLLIFTIPLFILFLVTTNEYHGLYYQDTITFELNGYLLSKRIPGPFYYLNIIFSYGVSCWGLYVFIKVWIKNNYSIDNPYFLFLITNIISIAVSVFYIAGKIPLGIDFLPFTFFISALAYAAAIFHYNILDAKYFFDQKVYSEMKEGLIVIDEKHNLLDYNKSASLVFDWLKENNVGRPIYKFQEGKDIVSNNEDQFNINLIKDNKEKYYEFRVTDLTNKKHPLGKLYIFLDITDKENMISELDFRANYDFLTQIYNRRKIINEFNNLIELTINRNENISILMLDIDHFKKVNDTYGHIAGDKVLSAVARQCKDIIGKSDLIGRYGGEEFLVILPDTNEENATIVAEKIRLAIKDLDIFFNEEKIKVTISIGVYSVNSNDIGHMTIEDLINLPDMAMYQAKKEGRDKVCVCK